MSITNTDKPYFARAAVIIDSVKSVPKIIQSKIFFGNYYSSIINY